MTLKPYAEMKESGIAWLGAVPTHWHTVMLKRVATLVYGDALPSELRNADGAVPVFGSNGVVGQHDQANTGEPVIIVGRKGSCGAVNWSDVSGFAIDTAYYIDGSHCEARLRWLYWLLPTLCLDVTSQDTGVPGLAREVAYQAQLVKPPTAEQAAIAAFLDCETAKIDALVAEQERLIALLAEKRRAVISHAVTKGLAPNAPMKESGIEWLGDVPAHWEACALKRYWSVTDCKHVTAEFVEDGYPLASIREVQSRYVDLTDAKMTSDEFYSLLISEGRLPQAGDLIFSRNATVGEVAQVAEWHPLFAMGQDVCLLRKQSPDCVTDYLQYVLGSHCTSSQLACIMIGSTFRRVNVEDLRALSVPMPPKPEQQAIVAHLDRETAKLDQLTAEAERAVALLKERRSALISAAVTGKIDVRGLVDAEEAAA
jgi:type I restriction enzyme S subunit